jgi:hypothetical protein
MTCMKTRERFPSRLKGEYYTLNNEFIYMGRVLLYFITLFHILLDGAIWPETQVRFESMWGSHLSSGRRDHTTRTTIVLAFWQISDNVVLTMFGEELLNCSI